MNPILQDAVDTSCRVGDSLFSGTIELPRLVLKQSTLQKNINAMNRYCAEAGVSLAPHAKTTMAPDILRAQLQSGVWGLTVATMHQLRVCLELGADRVIVANEVVNPQTAASLGHLLQREPSPEVYCLVDSTQGVALLAKGLEESGLSRSFPVLLELGIRGQRTGCRTPDDALRVANAVRAQTRLVLAGVEGYEGVIGTRRTAEELRQVDEYLHRFVALATRLAEDGFFGGQQEVLLTAGGTHYFDRVVDILRGAELGMLHRVVLRSGSYVTWDERRYDASPPGTVPGASLFEAAIQLWSEILSVPEEGLAIAGFGKRDSSYDNGLPVVLGRVRAGETHVEPISGVVVRRLNDQHAFLDMAGSRALEIGDRIVCGLTHPCTVFDKWRRFAVVDDHYRVVSSAETLF